MKNYYLLHIGVGNVGNELIDQLAHNQKFLNKKYNVNFVYCGLFISSGGIFNPKGISYNELKNRSFDPTISVLEALKNAPQPLIVIDTTASDKTYPYLIQALKRNAFVAISNKKPLASEQKNFNQLQKLGRRKLFFETTVGAGLPIIKTIQTLQATGDVIEEIQGVFSGTLGYICSNLERNRSFSEIVIEAGNKGYTEPDPRDDLSGLDVARKAIILARMLGMSLDLDNVNIEKLYPTEMESLSREEFFQALPQLDQTYKKKLYLLKPNTSLRYLATISKNGIEVGLKVVNKASLLGNLNGTDNIVIIKTKRYQSNPLVIIGPGAGVEVTAAGVFGDLLSIANVV